MTHTPTVLDLGPPGDDFLADVLRGLAAPDKHLPCKYFYDAAGSALFERICELDEYYPTRCELAIMDRHAGEMAALLGPCCLLIEYGSGSSLKTRRLLDRLAEPAGYVPIDIARDHLRASAAAVAADYPGLTVRPVCADFTRPLRLPDLGPAARRVVYFPGSTIGNLTPAESVRFFEQTARLCGPGGGLLLGADLKKDPRVLHAAYNDRDGVTAAFNLNLLARVNRDLGAGVPVECFWHHAFYSPGEGRIEMHLIARRDLDVRVAGELISFAEGESVRTEYSYKYTVAGLRALAAAGGWRVERAWADDRNWFGVLYLTVGADPQTRPGEPG